MKKSLILKLLCCGALLVGFSTGAFAQATRTWVSGVGDDVNPCSRTAPCKTFAGAISKTAEGGEIDALDPAGYGTLTIAKAMTVDGGTGSGWASVLNSGGISGFNVNITQGTHVNDAVVILRNITIQGASQAPSLGGLNGINIIKGNRTVVLNCHIENQTNHGINVNLTSTGAVFVHDTDFSNVNSAIVATTTSGAASVDASNIKVQGSVGGVVFGSNTSGTVTNSYFAKNIGGSAIQAGSGATLNLTHCHLRGNTTAVNALAGSVIRVNENEIFDNTNGLAGNAASFQSGGNNKIAGNTASLTPAGTPLATQ
jgi:hypothetical protein